MYNDITRIHSFLELKSCKNARKLSVTFAMATHFKLHTDCGFKNDSVTCYVPCDLIDC